RQRGNECGGGGGPRLAGALLRSRVVDEFIVYLAPSLLGPTARALVELPEISQLEQRMRLEFSECKPVGPDLRLTAVPVAQVWSACSPASFRTWDVSWRLKAWARMYA